MPIFKRYKIDRYKEVMINQSTGLIQDGGFSTYTFDNENNGDFISIVKDVRLIGEVIEMTMDTGRFSVNQINNTTQSEFDQLVSNGTIRVTERPLGWVEIAKTRASFYYEECSPTSFVRKRPISEHYYDFSTFIFGTSLLLGSGLQDTDNQFSIGESALRSVGTFDPNIGNNMGVFGPGFNQMDLQSYMRMVINSTISQGQGLIQNQQGESRFVSGWSPLDGEILRQIPLYLANKDEHFNNPNSQTISSGRYGRNRDIISEGFKASSYSGGNFSISVGQCLITEIISTGIQPTSVSPQTGGEMTVLPEVQTPANNTVLAKQFTSMVTETVSKILQIDPNFKFRSLNIQNVDNSPLVFFTPDEWPELLQYSLMTDFLLRDAFVNSKTIKNLDEARRKRLSGNNISNNNNSQNFQ
jgi:hypothetical protein